MATTNANTQPVDERKIGIDNAHQNVNEPRRVAEEHVHLRHHLNVTSKNETDIWQACIVNVVRKEPTKPIPNKAMATEMVRAHANDQAELTIHLAKCMANDSSNVGQAVHVVVPALVGQDHPNDSAVDVTTDKLVN